MKESVRAERFLYVKHALQYVNGHADSRGKGLPRLQKVRVGVV